VKSTQLFACTSSSREKDTNVFITPDGGTTYRLPANWNYGVNEYVIQLGGGTNTGFSSAGVGNVSLLLMASDSSAQLVTDMWRVINASAYNENAYGMPDRIIESGARHLNGSNILFADGHVKFSPQGQMALDPTRSAVTGGQSYQFKIPLRPDDDRVR
jgi:prepilin-type processing-associated H-X9-DG protein